MKKIQLLMASVLLLASCNSHPQNTVTYVPQPQTQQQSANIQVQAPPVPGFDIQAFNGLLAKTSDPNAIQQAINANGNNINNLDLDNNGDIDYLKVNQVDGNTLQVVDEVGNDPNQRTVLATLTINQQNNSYSIQGNQQYCGDTYVYNSQPGITLGNLLFLHWMLTPRTVYYHPVWGYHRYPRGYEVYHSHYRTPYNPGYIKQRSSVTTTTTKTTANVQRPAQQTQKPAVAPVPQRTSISNPQQSQRQFQVNTQNTGGQVKSGFGGSKTTGTSSSPSSSSSSGSRSYGSSKSSFGGGSRSSSSGSSHSSSGRRR